MAKAEKIGGKLLEDTVARKKMQKRREKINVILVIIALLMLHGSIAILGIIIEIFSEQLNPETLVEIFVLTFEVSKILRVAEILVVGSILICMAGELAVCIYLLIRDNE